MGSSLGLGFPFIFGLRLPEPWLTPNAGSEQPPPKRESLLNVECGQQHRLPFYMEDVHHIEIPTHIEEAERPEIEVEATRTDVITEGESLISLLASFDG